MASVKDHKSHELGLHKETLTGRTQQVFFNSEEGEIFFIMMLMKLILTKGLQ